MRIGFSRLWKDRVRLWRHDALPQNNRFASRAASRVKVTHPAVVGSVSISFFSPRSPRNRVHAIFNNLGFPPFFHSPFFSLIFTLSRASSMQRYEISTCNHENRYALSVLLDFIIFLSSPLLRINWSSWKKNAKLNGFMNLQHHQNSCDSLNIWGKMFRSCENSLSRIPRDWIFFSAFRRHGQPND